MISAERVTIRAEHFKVRRTECFVVGTEANRLAPAFPEPDPYSRELWKRISENADSVHGFPVMTILGIDNGFDVLGGRAAPGGLGWQDHYRDGYPIPTSAQQRHHYAFYFFGWASDDGVQQLMGIYGGVVNDIMDLVSGNDGDINLAFAARGDGIEAKVAGTTVVSGRIENNLCAP
jgi:hypothetical protein